MCLIPPVHIANFANQKAADAAAFLLEQVQYEASTPKLAISIYGEERRGEERREESYRFVSCSMGYKTVLIGIVFFYMKLLYV